MSIHKQRVRVRCSPAVGALARLLQILTASPHPHQENLGMSLKSISRRMSAIGDLAAIIGRWE